MIKPRFSNGQTVWVTFSDDVPEKMIIGYEPQFNPITRMFMYSFENAFTCGEIYLRAKLSDKKLTIDECLHDKDLTKRGILSECININAENYIQVEGVKSYSGTLSHIFFRPDKKFIKWLINYANGRVICDVGCGTAYLINDIADNGGKVMGIEPFWTVEDNLAMVQRRMRKGLNMINILPKDVEDCGDFIKGMGDKALMIFCRPCHNGFVENALALRSEGTEALYITVPVNFDKYDDLGVYKSSAVEIPHEGWSVDGEKVWSIR